MTTEVAPAASYPVHFAVERPQSQSRLTNFPLFIGTFIRSILLIPHFIVLYFFGIVAALLYLIAGVAILFSGRYPPGMYNLIAGYLRWSVNVSAYSLSLYDRYPPFGYEQQDGFPLVLTFEYPVQSSRLLNFPILAPILKSLLLLPHLIVLFFLGLAQLVVVFLAQFAILFKGAFPAGMHSFCVGVQRWNVRTQAYSLGLTDRYPPFSTQ